MNEITGSPTEESARTTVTSVGSTDAGGDNEPDQPESEATGRRGVGSVESTEWELPLDERFELLRNQRRRYVLQYLEGAEQVSLSELAEQIAAWENDKEIRQITSSERKRVYVGLYQCHLPKMDGMGVVSFNKSRGEIERGEHADAVEPYLRRAAEPERPSRDGPAVGLAALGITVLPVAILFLSQSALSLGVAALAVLAATVWGVVTLRESETETEANSGDPTSA